jgi:imidazole glycerol phosphate synthase subunit HisF
MTCSCALLQAVRAVQDFIDSGRVKTGTSCIEQIATVYGRQAVVISVDPRRVYVASPEETPHACLRVGDASNGAGGPPAGPNGEQYCWYRCTTSGARGQSEVDVPTLVAACADLGAGEVLLNLIDNDGVGKVGMGAWMGGWLVWGGLAWMGWTGGLVWTGVDWWVWVGGRGER